MKNGSLLACCRGLRCHIMYTRAGSVSVF